MPNKMLIDATHPEETRVVVLRGNRVEEFDFESASRRQLRGNIYLAKVTRVEPSLQAAFVDYGGNRHGFLAFSEIHPDYYQIPVADRQALIDEEERAHRDAEAEADRRAGMRGRPRHRRAAHNAADAEVVTSAADRSRTGRVGATPSPPTSAEHGEPAADTQSTHTTPPMRSTARRTTRRTTTARDATSPTRPTSAAALDAAASHEHDAHEAAEALAARPSIRRARTADGDMPTRTASRRRPCDDDAR